MLMDTLTKRETAIAELLCDGKSNKAIANALGIADRTVKMHLRSIYSKLMVAGRTQAVGLLLAERIAEKPTLNKEVSNLLFQALDLGASIGNVQHIMHEVVSPDSEGGQTVTASEIKLVEEVLQYTEAGLKELRNAAHALVE